MSEITLQSLRSLVNERLAAAAEEILGVFERTVVNYEEEVFHCKKEINRQKNLLDTVLLPETRLQRLDPPQLSVCEEELLPEQQERSPSLGQEEPEPLQIKEEWEKLWTSQEGEQLQDLEEADIIKFLSTPFPVKSEQDEEKPQSSWFNQTQTEPLASTSTEQMKTEPDGEDCGVSEPASNLDPAGDLEPTTDGQPLSSDCSETDDSDNDWKPRSGLNTLKSKKTRKNKGRAVLSSDDDDVEEEEADNASTGSINRLESVSPRPADSAHSSAAPSGGRVEAAVNSTGEREDIASEFSEDVSTKIPLTRRRRMKVKAKPMLTKVTPVAEVTQFGQNVPKRFSPRAKKPKVASKKCERIILECRSVRLGSLRRMLTKPVVFSTDHIQLETVGAENQVLEKVSLRASEIISCEWCSSRKLPVLFFQTTQEECLRLRTQLNMSQERGGPWYDCAGNQCNEKYIILILENGMTMSKQVTLENILKEIGIINNLNRFPTKLSLDETNVRLVSYNKATKEKEEKVKAMLTKVTQVTPVSPVSEIIQVTPVSKITQVNTVSQPVLTRMATRQQASAFFDDEDEDMSELHPTFSGPIEAMHMTSQ